MVNFNLFPIIDNCLFLIANNGQRFDEISERSSEVWDPFKNLTRISVPNVKIETFKAWSLKAVLLVVLSKGVLTWLFKHWISQTPSEM